MSRFAPFIVIFLILSAFAFTPMGVSAYNNTSLEWYTIKTEHFAIHYHLGSEWTAGQVAKVAEEVRPFITAVYNYEPKDKVHFVIKDTDDFANGATYYYDNKIEIWATNLDFEFRGTSKWIQNVVIHEYTHMISLQAGFKFTRFIPALYFQLIDFEKEKRPDVLTGYPSHIVSYPLAGSVIPPWFAEGIAQYQSPEKRYDCWDTHRDMILRCVVLEDKMLTYDEMGFFGHSSMRNEEVYDHGFGLVSYIAHNYGAESLGEIVRAMRSLGRFKFDGAVRRVTGKTGRELYQDWKNHMKKKYESQAASIRQNLLEGQPLTRDGYMTISPSWSPDGERIAFLSNQGSDFSGTALYIINKDGTGLQKLKGGVSSGAAFSPDGKKIVYSKKIKADRYGVELNDLFVYDFAAKKEKRLTRKLRASFPSFSPDGEKLIAVLNGDGTHSLAVMDASGDNLRILFSGERGMQFYSPRFFPDGSRVLFGIFRGSTRQVAAVSSDGKDFSYLLRSPHDERDARWTLDGGRIVFASDRTGVFNIYELDLLTNLISRRTNVIGGAFMPAISSASGELAYAGFHAEGYGIELLASQGEKFPSMSMKEYEKANPNSGGCALIQEEAGAVAKNPLPGESNSLAIPASYAREKPALMGDEIEAVNPTGGVEKKKYKPTFTPFLFYPRFVLYDRSPRVGIFMTGAEILDKQSFYLGASYGFNNEFDAFVSYELRYLYPTIFAEFVRLRESFDDQVVPRETPWEMWDLKLRYDLWEFRMGLRLELEDVYSITERNNFTLFFTHGEYSVHIDADLFDSRDNMWRYGGKGSWKYYIGNEITARYHYKQISKEIDSDINPRGGRKFTVEYIRALDRLFTSGEFEYGFYPRFDKNYHNRYSIEWIEYLALPSKRHTLQLKLYAAAIDKKVDNFFYFYVGGRDYLRGYTYYSIGGRKALLGSVTYRFPILRNFNRQFLHLYFRDIYGGVFYEAANAWNEDKLRTFGYRKSLGGELRINMGSFYVFPTALSIVSSYSLDSFSSEIPLYDQAPVVFVSDKGWSTYLTLGFGF